jgi:SAM-dependent methyltransferase
VFDERMQGSEYLDRPDCDPELTKRSFAFIRFVNRYGGGIRVVRRFLASELRRLPAGEPVRVLDLGAGDCDIPLALTRWARVLGRRLEFTCIDHNPVALALGKASLAKAHNPDIRLEEADVFHYAPTGPIDYVIGSMFFHHFTEDQIGSLIERLRTFVRRALLINDLHRRPLNYVACSILTLGADPKLRHDSLLSILRGFTPTDLARLLRRHDPSPAVWTDWFCRIAAVVRFDGKEGS